MDSPASPASEPRTAAAIPVGAARAAELRASPPLFASPTLDRLTRVHPAVPLALYGPVAVGLLAWGVADGAGWASIGLVPLGYVLWTII